jgi:superfamily II DNA or RNA helicase
MLPFVLYDYQESARQYATRRLRERVPHTMIVSPTGSGKSYIQAAILHDMRDEGLVQTTPNLEISLSIYTKLVGNKHVLALSEARQQQACEDAGIWTIKRLYNQLMQAAIDPPKYLSHDESQHSVDATHDTVWALVGNCPRVGLTATYFRGTPAETQKLRDQWGEPYEALSLKAAVARGVVAMPTFDVWPLMNDDTLIVTNGEFVAKQVDAMVEDVLGDIVERLRALFDATTGLWKRATMVCVNGVASADAVTIALNTAGLPAVSVTGDTPRSARESAFQATAYDRTHALVQVKVVGEGVDLPFREQVDLAPTMSPMWFMQRVGRNTRPVPDGEPPPRIIVCNHNLTRHAYLWQGLIPPAQVRAAQLAWGPDYRPSRRSMARAIGLEGFGKFTVSAVPALDGSLVSLYSLQTKDGLHQYAVLLHACLAEPFYVERTNVKTGKRLSFTKPDGSVIEYDEKQYGPWKRIKGIPDATGYTSVRPRVITEPMREWWVKERSGAASVGLDPTYSPNAREFEVLPIMKDARIKFKVEG